MLEAHLFYHCDKNVLLKLFLMEQQITYYHPIMDIFQKHVHLKKLLKRRSNGYEYIFPVEYIDHVEHFFNKDSLCVLVKFPGFVHKMINAIDSITFKNIENHQDIQIMKDKIHNELPEKTRMALFDYQYQTLLYAQTKNKLLIADDPGLGKTLQAICISALYQEKWPVLVVCPSSVKKMWANEYMKWLDINKDDIHIVNSGKDFCVKKVTIISYGLLHVIDNHKFDFIICDESHSIKTYNSKRTKLLTPILKKANRVILLSGTPALSNPLELQTQVSILFDTFINYHEYAERYCLKRLEFNRVKYYGYKELDELFNILTESVMIRRNKSDLITNIPEKTRHKVYLSLSAEKIKEFDVLKKELEKNNNIYTKKYDMMALFRKIGALKTDGIIHYFSTHNVYQEKIIIFAHHLSILDKLEEELKNNHVKYISIRGDTKSSDRQVLIDQYQDPHSDIKVALLSLTAAGVGITLTAAKKVYFTELFWTPGLLLQAEDRAHRHGQKNKVDIFYMVAKNTIDDAIWRSIMYKMRFCTNTFDGKVKNLEIDSIIRDISHLDTIFDKEEQPSAKRQKIK